MGLTRYLEKRRRNKSATRLLRPNRRFAQSKPRSPHLSANMSNFFVSRSSGLDRYSVERVNN